MTGLKQTINKAMQDIARRRPGNSKLVYDKTTKTIMVQNRAGVKKPSGLGMPNGFDEANFF